VNPQLPAGILVNPGTPLSVAYVASVTVAPDATVVEKVTCPVDVGIGLNCLYVGVPKADDVFNDWFMYKT